MQYSTSNLENVNPMASTKTSGIDAFDISKSPTGPNGNDLNSICAADHAMLSPQKAPTVVRHFLYASEIESILNISRYLLTTIDYNA
jgi:hypothetical protein